MSYCVFNGKIVEQESVGIPLNDLGVLRGFGVFAAFRTFHKKPFLIQKHIARLMRSAAAINLPMPVSAQQLETEISLALEKNNFPESVIRIIVTGGPSEDGLAIEKPGYFVLIKEFVPFKPEIYTAGTKIILHDYSREYPGAKTISYITAVSLQATKKDAGASEIVYNRDGKILEGATSNVFLWDGKTLVTPDRGTTLRGITQETVLQLVDGLLPVQERVVSVKELQQAQEIFLTSSIKGIVPVVRVDDQKISGGVVGAQTKKVMQLYEEYTHGGDWL